MKESILQTMVHTVRSATPLKLRQKIGPVVAYVFYIWNTKIRKNSKKPNVLSISDTIDRIIEKNLSVIRFGDGEISLIDGLDLSFQVRDESLVKKLETIIRTDRDDVLICIPGVWESLDVYEPYAYWFNMHHVYRCGHMWKRLISLDRVYGDTNMTRSYLAYKDKSNCEQIFKKIFSIWKSKDVVLIEGEKSRLGVGNDMFDEANSVKRILCPPENAYKKYDAIKRQALTFDTGTLVLLSLGPTAKVLAYELLQLGYRVIDIGHIDMEYEMCLRGETKQTKVPYKYFNEIHARDPEECLDETYVNQIVARIS